MTKPKVLISDALSPAAVQIFKDRGIEVDFQPTLGKDKDKLAEIIVMSVCPAGQRQHITQFLAMGADRAVIVDANEDELDTNTVERAIRPITLGRKNHLFAGSDGGADRWAIVATLITTAKLNDVEPYAYLKDVLERMAGGQPMARLDDLLPWNWKAAAASP